MEIINTEKVLKTGNVQLCNILNSEFLAYWDWCKQNKVWFTGKAEDRFIPAGPDILNPWLPTKMAFSSWGVREGSPSHGKNLALDISRADVKSDKDRIHIGLFGLWLAKHNKGRYHCAISVHNAHLHIDLLPERKGKNSIECYEIYSKKDDLGFLDDLLLKAIDPFLSQGKKRYYFKDLYKNIDQVHKQYWFDRHPNGKILATMIGENIDEKSINNIKDNIKDSVTGFGSSAKKVLMFIAGLMIFKTFKGGK